MPLIQLETQIKAPIDRVFDLCRSVDLHLVSSQSHGETVVGGRLSGLMELGETVTWRAKHLGFVQELTSIITASEPPYLFEDQLEKGIFQSFTHQHLLEQKTDHVSMIDLFEYRSPLGILGRIADVLIVERHMRNYLQERNSFIKNFAETDRWKSLPGMVKD